MLESLQGTRRAIIEESRHLAWKLRSRLSSSFRVSSEQGVFEVLSGDWIIGRQLYVLRQYELDYTTSVLDFLRSIGQCPPRGEGTVLDVGANIGVTSIGMLHKGEFARAIAVEAEPGNFRLLEHNCRLNGMEDRITCLNYAASDHNGDLVLELNDVNFGAHRVQSHAPDDVAHAEPRAEGRKPVVSVPCRRLDDLLAGVPGVDAGEVSLLWIDVEGHESFAFQGATELLSSGIPVVCEINPDVMRRAGVPMEHFCSVARGNWSSYWVLRPSGFVRYPIDTLPVFFEELGWDGPYDSVVFTK